MEDFMAARTTRLEARERIIKSFMDSLDKIIPREESVPLRGQTFLDWEQQADAMRKAVLPTMRVPRRERGKRVFDHQIARRNRRRLLGPRDGLAERDQIPGHQLHRIRVKPNAGGAIVLEPEAHLDGFRNIVMPIRRMYANDGGLDQGVGSGGWIGDSPRACFAVNSAIEPPARPRK
jgi:hypothetical protein